MVKIIEWDNEGYPTEKSLDRLEKVLDGEDVQSAKKAFYEALKENHYKNYDGAGLYGLTQAEVRGELIDVWEYHTLGWSGNEAIMAVLKTCWLYDYLLERYDRGGHYYFRPCEELVKNGG